MSDTDDLTYVVVINDEEQYSIWPEYREIPDGWRDEGTHGSKEACLDHIEKVWTDMRPLSLRKQMEDMARVPPPPQEPLPLDDTPPLAERLSGETHKVVVRSRIDDKVTYLRERIEIGHVHVLFSETRGGTELGLALDAATQQAALSALDKGDEVSLSGALTLDDTHVICKVRLTLPDLVGQGGLQTVDA